MVFPSNSISNQVMDRLSFFSDSLCSTDPSRECHAIPLCHVPWCPALARRLWRIFQKVSSFGRPNQFVIVLSTHSFRKAKGPVGGPASYPSPDDSRPCIAASGKPNLGGHQATTIFVQDFKDPPESRWPCNPGFVGHQYPRRLDQAPFTHQGIGELETVKTKRVCFAALPLWS